MDKEETKEAINIMKAWLRGKPIECRRKIHEDDWRQYTEYFWDFHLYEYRLKTDAKPYDSAADVHLQTIIECKSDKTQWRISGTSLNTDGSLYGVFMMTMEKGQENGQLVKPEVLLENFEYLTGEPCGISESKDTE